MLYGGSDFRFTPASAGNTFSFFFSSFTFRVHPRLRGEYYYRLQRVKKPAGSPPPPRGIRKKARLPRYVIRFTPASAGNTYYSFRHDYTSQVHPRLRGEYLYSWIIVRYKLGSPPPPRGILGVDAVTLNNIRFTPASAGNTHQSYTSQHNRQVHPRLRGEYSNGKKIQISIPGSPPPPRGIHTDDIEKNSNDRFTPASAGNTYIAAKNTWVCQVHPRLRGEYYNLHIQGRQFIGSPPPPRGIP